LTKYLEFRSSARPLSEGSRTGAVRMLNTQIALGSHHTDLIGEARFIEHNRLAVQYGA
jgi:hypothetical protein